MATLTIYGCSDDLIELDGIPGSDEFNDTKGKWRGLLEAPNGDTAIVYVDYRPNGCWTVALGQYDEDYRIPAWHQTVEMDEASCRYSAKMTIEVPDGTTIREWNE